MHIQNIQGFKNTPAIHLSAVNTWSEHRNYGNFVPDALWAELSVQFFSVQRRRNGI